MAACKIHPSGKNKVKSECAVGKVKTEGGKRS